MQLTKQKARAQIAFEFNKSGVYPGGIILVHSSLSSLGHVPGGPETVIQGMLDALGPNGTLLLPALSYATVTAENPVFDVIKTPSCIGTIPEYFRKKIGTIRSLHPTHSVCGIGPLADEMLNEHHLDDSPGGPHSPYRKLKDKGGQIVMLGCGLKPNTSMHAVEELVEPPYLFRGMVTYQMTRADGTTFPIDCKRHGFKGYIQRYDRVEPLLQRNGLTTGKVLSAEVYIIEVPRLWEKALQALQQDPFYFVEKQA